jgi:hypothetical protein
MITTALPHHNATGCPCVSHAAGSPLHRPERTQVEHELTLALADLGGATFALAHHGALTDERLASRVRRIHELFARLNALDHSMRTSQQNDDPATALAA